MANTREVAQLVTPSRLDSPLVVLRKVDVAKLSVRVTKNSPSIMEMIGSGHVDQGTRESQLVWFKNGYVLNDQPRTVVVTDEIMRNTTGFAIARTDTGEIIREGGPDTLSQMLKLVEGAELKLAVDTVILEDEETEAPAPSISDDEAFSAAAAAQVAAEQAAEGQSEQSSQEGDAGSALTSF